MVAVGKGLAVQGKVAQTNQASAQQSVMRRLSGLVFWILQKQTKTPQTMKYTEFTGLGLSLERTEC